MKRWKQGLICILSILCLVLLFGCEMPLDIFAGEIILTPMQVGDTIFNITRNGVNFVGIQTGLTLVRINMVNSTGIARVNYTVKSYTGLGLLSNSVTRTNVLYPHISQGESFHIPMYGYISFTINSITR
jgi:hypothetical protein